MNNNFREDNSPTPPPRTVSENVVHINFPNNLNNMESRKYINNLIRRNQILMEYKYLRSLSCKNIFILPSNDIFKWMGVIFVHEGFYKGGIFKFNLMFSEHQKVGPSLQFITNIYHPLVDKYGYFNQHYDNTRINSVNTLLYMLNDMLGNESKLFEIEEKVASNKNAWEALNTNIDLFRRSAYASVENSLLEEALYDNCNENEEIVFKKVDDEHYLKNKNNILKLCQNIIEQNGRMELEQIIRNFTIKINKIK